MAIAQFLADKSVLARAHQPAVLAVVGPLVRSGLLATCGIVESEMLFSARNLAEHDETRRRLRAFEWLTTPDEVWRRVHEVQRELTEGGQHRSVPIADLVIAATAERHGITVLHYDADFDVIGAVTGQSMRWVVRRGHADAATPGRARKASRAQPSRSIAHRVASLNPAALPSTEREPIG